jgi:hypothetical protein
MGWLPHRKLLPYEPKEVSRNQAARQRRKKKKDKRKEKKGKRRNDRQVNNNFT